MDALARTRIEMQEERQQLHEERGRLHRARTQRESFFIFIFFLQFWIQ